MPRHHTRHRWRGTSKGASEGAAAHLSRPGLPALARRTAGHDVGTVGNGAICVERSLAAPRQRCRQAHAQEDSAELIDTVQRSFAHADATACSEEPAAEHGRTNLLPRDALAKHFRVCVYPHVRGHRRRVRRREARRTRRRPPQQLLGGDAKHDLRWKRGKAERKGDWHDGQGRSDGHRAISSNAAEQRVFLTPAFHASQCASGFRALNQHRRL